MSRIDDRHLRGCGVVISTGVSASEPWFGVNPIWMGLAIFALISSLVAAWWILPKR